MHIQLTRNDGSPLIVPIAHFCFWEEDGVTYVGDSLACPMPVKESLDLIIARMGDYDYIVETAVQSPEGKIIEVKQDMTMDQIEGEALQSALLRHKSDIRLACKQLGISLQRARKLAARYNLNYKRDKKEPNNKNDQRLLTVDFGHNNVRKAAYPSDEATRLIRQAQGISYPISAWLGPKLLSDQELAEL